MRLSKPKHPLNFSVTLPYSKSVLNRELVIKHLAGDALAAVLQSLPEIEMANDTLIIHRALTSGKADIDAEDAGTALRFLTAALTFSPVPVSISGTARLQQRPMQPLIDALRICGADIRCTGTPGFAPVEIYPSTMRGGEITLDASFSSQFVSALLMVAPYFEQGLILHLQGNQVSASYTRLTIDIMKRFGVQVEQYGAALHVSPQQYRKNQPLSLERDWSAAAFWYMLAGVLPLDYLCLNDTHLADLQGDVQIAHIARQLGVSSTQMPQGVVLSKAEPLFHSPFTFDFSSVPDLVPAIVVWCSVAQIPAVMNGVAHLRYKESDRLAALTTELAKAGVIIQTVGDSNITLTCYPMENEGLISLKTYDDHRLAMSWSALVANFSEVHIEQPLVIRKSYPAFWQQLNEAGFLYNEL